MPLRSRLLFFPSLFLSLSPLPLCNFTGTLRAAQGTVPLCKRVRVIKGYKGQRTLEKPGSLCERESRRREDGGGRKIFQTPEKCARDRRAGVENGTCARLFGPTIHAAFSCAFSLSPCVRSCPCRSPRSHPVARRFNAAIFQSMHRYRDAFLGAAMRSAREIWSDARSFRNGIVRAIPPLLPSLVQPTINHGVHDKNARLTSFVYAIDKEHAACFDRTHTSAARPARNYL